MIKISDIASKANVSISTVSKVINNRPRISDEVRKRVLDICEEMNYKPNFFASNLAIRNTKTLGFIINSKPMYEFFTRDIFVTQSCVIEAAISGYDLHICYLNEDKKIDDVLNFSRIPIDGAIISGPKIDGLCESTINKEHIPFVVIGNPTDNTIPFVNVNNFDLVRKIAHKLFDFYKKDIYLINSSKGLTISIDRYNAFSEVCLKNNIDINKHHFFVEDESKFMESEMLKKLVKKDSAFIVANENMAKKLYSIINNKKLLVGDDVGVFSLGMKDENEYFEPKLSHATQDYISIGKYAVKLLLEYMKENKKSKNIILDCEIKINESTSRLLDSE